MTDDSEEDRIHRARDESAAITKPLFGPYPSVSRVASPKPTYQAKVPNMDHPRDLTLPPIDRREPERRWNTEPLEVPYKSYQQESKPRSTVDLGDKITPSVPSSHTPRPVIDDLNEPEREGTMETTRAGVQVEMKKRKRQFANRTKTGCGTCRRRKKKCDEAKPECTYLSIPLPSSFFGSCLNISRRLQLHTGRFYMRRLREKGTMANKRDHKASAHITG